MIFRREHTRTRQTMMKCVATVSKFGETRPPNGDGKIAKLYQKGILDHKPTVMVIDVKTVKGEDVIDHAWFTMDEGFDKVPELRVGDIVQMYTVWLDKDDGVQKLKLVGVPKKLVAIPVTKKRLV